MHISFRESEKGFVLFAVNTAVKKQRVKFTFPSDKGDKVMVVSEKRRIPLKKNSFSDDFGIYATHIYTNLPELACAMDLKTKDKEIQLAEEKRKKPGNIAFWDEEVKLDASPETKHYVNQFVNDGMSGNVAGGWYVKKGPAWFSFQWPYEQEIGRVVLYRYGFLGDFDIQAQIPNADGTWQMVATKKAGNQKRIELKFKPVKTKTLRILVDNLPKFKSPREKLFVNEIEVYPR